MKFFKSAALAVGFLSFALIVPAEAATETFAWTISGPAPSLGGVPFPGSGTITGTVLPGGDVQATSITGTINGSMITSLITTFPAAPVGPPDNLLFPTGTTFLSTHGISFVTAAGQDFNFFSFFPQGTPPSGNAYGRVRPVPRNAVSLWRRHLHAFGSS
jgi:hypothetical protein